MPAAQYYCANAMTFISPRFAKTFALALFLAAVSGAACAKEVALVVAKSSALRGVQSVEVVKAFKTAPARWADGKEIVFVVKAPSSSETKVFGTKLLNQVADQLPAF